MNLEFEENGPLASTSVTEETRANTIEELKNEIKELEHLINLHERGEKTITEEEIRMGETMESIVMSYKERIVAKKDAIARLEVLG